MTKNFRSSWIVLTLVWLAFLLWQFFSWRHERGLIEETVHQQAQSVASALTGGIRSHRRLGRFVQFQLSVILDALASTPDVLAVEILNAERETLVGAGEVERLHSDEPLIPGGSWQPSGYRLVERVTIEPSTAAEPGDSFGPGLGGFRQGRGGFWAERVEDENESFDLLRREGGQIVAVLLLDRTRADALQTGAIWSHCITSVAGGLVLLGLGLALRGNLKLIAERNRSELLRLEAQHYRDMGQSAAGLAHETRNPLGTIRGWAERLASTDNDSETRKRQASLLVEECDRVTARINEFLTFTKPYQPKPECVDFRDLIAELAMLLEPDLESKSLNLVCSNNATSTWIRADRELLRQALFNLVQNAIHASPNGRDVEIRQVSAANGKCRIEVADRGSGVTADQAPSLFTPYFTTRSLGTGLGLAIVRKIAVTQGWSATYRDRDGEGSVFALEGVEYAE
ncbi:sensor histidine kinase [Crateriforma conspicua]|uniref:sensor histidine kinase n=1 Tax=Crateriforma conspicua TaxID=2527996 RepID=UPI001189E878|nr:ATP-binding protein [Crateriforma conspicua]QDV63991.1 Sensor protein ZraS [Crateriforma conspicua]